MTDEPRTPYLGYYLAILVAAIIGMAVLIFVVQWLTGVNIGGGATAIVPPMAAAMLVGQRWAKQRGATPTSKEAWRFAFVAGLVFFALQILLALMVAASGVLGPVNQGFIGLMVGLVIAYTAVAILMHRWFVMMGARSALKAK
ncbi:ABZJ_00895 family protein [Pontivivens ytuae]|uniref:Uncharacterized protein n=1 Tax=Pontivivens ytuae TaxID=2789856 RepID=A0A7S9LRN3_9RHOB|nr:ABZJ_00895 family protein [Pontivivens ytuae]QPH53876.1 hypothetical protein I0K15_19205 [Pontivivens ytuae]